jgi:F0F1-type ATP synthase membrane subunit b/b'
MIKLPPDWTFVAQIICFFVFWQLMRWALFGPVQRALEARAARTSGDRARAEALRAEADALAAAVEAQLAAGRREGAREAEEIRRRAETEEQAILARYRAEALAVLARERATTSTQVTSARAPLRIETDRLAASVVEKILGRPA